MVDGVISAIGRPVQQNVEEEHKLELEVAINQLLKREEQIVKDIRMKFRNATKRFVLPLINFKQQYKRLGNRFQEDLPGSQRENLEFGASTQTIRSTSSMLTEKAGRKLLVDWYKFRLGHLFGG